MNQGTIENSIARQQFDQTGVCPTCGHNRADDPKPWGCNIDQKLVSFLLAIYKYCRNRQTLEFVPKEVFEGWLDERTHFQKLRYFGLIKKIRTNRWRLTMTGYLFLRGEVPIPRKVYVSGESVVTAPDESMVTISDVEPRWQTDPLHYQIDRIPEYERARGLAR